VKKITTNGTEKNEEFTTNDTKKHEAASMPIKNATHFSHFFHGGLFPFVWFVWLVVKNSSVCVVSG
jgi:hypothetical protein